MALKPFDGSLDTPQLKPFTGQLDQPAGGEQGVSAGDFLKAGVGSVVQAVGGTVRGAAEGLRAAPTARSIAPVADAVATAGDWLGQKGADIAGGMSQAAQRAVAGSTPQGSIADPRTWSLGEDPSVAGYALQATQGLGSIVPTAVAGIASRGRLGPSAGVAAATGGGFAAQGEQQRIEDMDEASIGQLPAYQALLADGMAPQQARAQLARTAASSAFRYTAPVSAADALVEVLPFAGAAQRALGRVVGPSRLARGAAGAVGGAAGEAAQEVAEGAAATLGANAATGESRDPLEGSLANATLGAMIGGPIGGAAGLLTPADRVGADVPAPTAGDALAAGGPQPVQAEVQRTVINPADGPLSRSVATDAAEQAGTPVQPVVVTTVLADEQQLDQQRKAQELEARKGKQTGATAPTTPAGGGESPAPAASAATPAPIPPAVPPGIDPETGQDTRTPEQKRAQIAAELAGRLTGMIDSTTVTAIARKLMVDRSEVSRIRGELRAAERATAAPAAQPPEDSSNGTTESVQQDTLPLGDGGRRPGSAADGADQLPGDSEPGTSGVRQEAGQEGNEEGRQEGAGQEDGGQAAGREAGQRQAVVPDLTYDESGEQLDGDITTPSGTPFTIRDAADRAAKRHPGGRVVELDDGAGFVIRTPKESPDVSGDGSVSPSPQNAPDAGAVPPAAAAGADAESAPVDAPSRAADEAEPATGQGGAPAPAPANDGTSTPNPEAVADETTQIPASPGAGAAGAEAGRSPPASGRRASTGGVSADGGNTAAQDQLRQPDAGAGAGVEPGPVDGVPSQFGGDIENDTAESAAAGSATGGDDAGADQGAGQRPAVAADENGLIAVKDVYGKTVRVKKSDLDGTRTMLPMYRKDGSRLTGRGGRNESIVRDNIAKDDGSNRVKMDLPYFAAKTEKGERPFKSVPAARRAVREAGESLDDYEIQRSGDGFIAVRKAKADAPAAAAGEQAAEPAAPAEQPRASEPATAPADRSTSGEVSTASSAPGGSAVASSAPEDEQNVQEGGAKPRTRTTKGKTTYVESHPQTLAAYFTPGRVVKSYGGWDRVISFTPNVGEGLGWSVRVIGVNEDGSPKAGEVERGHSTVPDQQDLVRVFGKANPTSGTTPTTTLADTGQAPIGDDNERGVQSDPAEGRGQESLEEVPAGDARAPGEGGDAGAGTDGGSDADAPADGSSERSGADGRGSVAGGASPVPDTGSRRGRRADRTRAAGRDVNDLFGEVAGDTSVQQPGGQPPSNYHIPADLPLGEGGAKAKFNGNIAAIRLLKQLEAEGRSATPEEQGVLARYVGWGGIPQAFANPSTGKIAAGWEKQVQQLEDALTPDELLAARQSTQNAHYTSREVIGGVFDAVQRLGLSGGTVIEPSVGTGNFIGLTPDALRGALRWTAVELDSITGRIASKLYPQAHVIAGRGFQEVSVPENHFDAAIGNPPFGQETLFDPAHPDLKGFSIHNFFFAKSLKSLRPGGVLAMVVSHSFMDKASGKQRRWISDHARLLGAIRLPDTAFKANAGTEVTTDIVFLQKLHPGEKADATWTEIGSVPDPAGGDPIPLSQYFIQHPEMMLGTMTREGSMRYSGQPTLSERPGSDLSEQLRQAVQHLPQNVMDGPRTIPQGETAPVSDLSEDVAVYSHFIGADGKIRQRMPDVLDQQVERVVEVTGKDADRIKGMIGLRDSLKALMRAELSDAPDATTNRMRAALSDQYDKFQKEYGYLNSQKNVSLFRDDADAYRLRALEVGYTRLSAEEAEAEGITMPKGRKTAESAKKADILSRRVLNPSRTPKAATAQDALIVSLNTTGRVDMQRMAMMLGKDEQAVIDELGGKLFMDPDAGWVTDDAYLSGNVKAKLARAITAASTNPDLQRNVDALRGVQPADLSPADIAVGIGAPWVPGSDYERFASEVLGAQVSVSWNSVASKFSVGMRGSRGSAQHGTSRLTAAELFERAINHQPGMVYDIIREPGGGERRQINNEATTAANAKLDEIRDAFSNWVWKDQSRRERLAQFYNDNYNTDRQRTYDGSFLTFPGMTDQIKLRPSQKNAIWRGVQEGRYLLDHVVGAGKTYTVIATAMTAKRMGLQRKPMVAVPNHLVEQWAADWLRLYPGANVLAVTKEDFAKDRRKLLFSRIATGDWDAVVIAHSQFTRIAVPPEFELEYLNEQIAEYEMALDAAKKDRDGMTTKNLAKRRDTIKEKLKARMSRTTRDTDTANMQEMGIDALYVDEAHEFKNLEFVTTKRNVSGLGNPAGSQKAADLFMKVRYLSRTYDGRGTYFATGTPVSNSLAEMFTMQRYLAEADLRARGIHTFDAWSNTFAVEESQFQIDSTGRGLKPKTVLTKFVNVAEMMAIYWRFADIVLQQDLNRIALETTGKPFPVPKVAGGRAQNVVVPAGASLSRYIEQVIIPRTQAIAGEPITYTENGVTMQRMVEKPDPSVDNMLKVTNDARLAALDVRLRMPEAADDPGSKVNEAMRRIVAKWKATKKRRGTQLVFCDLSTPKGSQASERAEFDALVSAAENGDEDAQAKLDKMSPDEILALETAGFSVYDDLKQKLIAEGIPAQEIAFIHDAKTDLQKKALFNKVRSGAVRVLMGSTSKMGAGTNVQNKLVALHHLDAPWRPSDLEQREGRIIRQGNEFYAEDPDGFEVEINRYATERTYDSRMWQLIEQKAAVVEQIRTADAGTREIDDIGGQAANAAEMKAAATGNPLIIEQVELQDKVKRLGMLKRAHEGRIYEAERRLASLNADGGPDGRAQRALAEVEPEIAFIDAHPAPRGDAFTIKVKGKTFTEHGKGAAALAVAIVDADEEMKRTTRSNIPLGTYRGLELSLAKSQFLNQRTVTVTIPGLGEVGEIGNPSNAEGKVSGAGILTRVDGFARAIQAKPAGIESQRKAEHKAIAEWTDVAAATFKQAAELSTATERLRDITAELSVKPAAVDQPLQVDESEQGAQSRGEPERARQPLETEFVVGVRDLDRTVRKIVGQWKGDIPTVRAIESADQLPDFAKRQVGWETAEGWYDGRGTIYLIANNLANLTRAQQVLAHEAFGHYGVEGVLGSADWARITGQVAKLRKDPGSLSAELQAALASVERRYPDATPGTFAREFIAVMAERGVRGGLMTRVLAGLRRWLRALGFDFSGWQDAELRDIVVRGMRQVATTAAQRRTDGMRGPAQGRAFHGTDMREIERFQLARIGTGEGRDAFGWGLYFASQQDVADFYRRNVSGFARNIPATMADQAMQRAGGDRATALRDLTRKRDALPEAARGQTQAAIDWLRRGQNRGQVYEVDIPDADQLLDWDASVDEQPEAVRARLDDIMASDYVDQSTREEWGHKKGAARTGMGFYRTLAMSNNLPGGLTGNEGASALLREFGIPGLRYLDGDSRTGGDGSHNFVIWDEAAIGAPRGLFSLPDSQKFDAIMGGIRGEDSIIQRLKDKVEDARPALLGALTTRQLVEVTGGYLPAAKGYQGLADRMAARRNVLQSEVGGLAMKWQRMQTKDRRKAGAARRAARDTDSDRTADLMHDATIAGTDPAEAYEVSTVTLTSNGETVPLDADSATAAIGRLEAKLADKEWRRNAPDAIVNTMQADIRRIEAGMVVERERASAYPGLKQRFNALPKEWQDLYREVRDAYANRADQMLDALLDRIEQLEIDERTKAALRERMRANFESARVHAPYFPLARFGDYWVSFSKRGANGDMERQFVMAETKRERDRAIKAAEAAGYMVDKLGRKIENVRAQDGASGTFVSEVNEALQAAGVGESVRDEIYQLYLRTLPDLSTRKNFIHRKKVAGYDQDALRAFAGQMFHGAHQLARLEFQPRMQDQLTKIVNEAKAMQDTADEDADRASVAAGEFKKRHEWIMNPTNAGWVQTLSAINFVYYLGVSPAAALVNLSQTAITTFPALASKYGWMRALNTTLATVRDAAKNVRYGDDTGIRRSLKSDDERAAYEQLQKMGAIDVTQAHDLAGLGDSDTRGYSPTAHKVMNAVSFLFHKAEVVNREATAIAAYRLAREAGKPHQAAVQEAADTIWQTHFDYSAANRARFMQGNAAKVLFAFKQYSQSMTYFLWRAFYESMKGETKQVRNEARQRLVGTLGMTGVFAGVMGMPLLSLFFGVANAMAAAFGDDDEPFSAEVEFRNFLTDMLGAKLGGIAQEGLVEGGLEALGLKAPEVGSRVSLNDLWIRSADPDVEGRDLYVHLLEQAAGPIAGMLGNGITASSMIGEGLTTDNAGMVWRGVEKGMPKAVRDGMKFIRYEVHGVNTLRGDPLVPDANVIDSIYQGLGLMPADLARQYEANSAVKQYERYVLERRQSLLDAYAIATRHKDMEAVRATNEKIRAFNQRWPEIAVSASTIRRSLQSRERYSERAVNGITLNSRIGDRVRDAVRFDGEGE